MKKLILSLFLAMPLLVTANTLQFNTMNKSNSIYDAQFKVNSNKKTVQFGSFSTTESALNSKNKSNIQKLALDNRNVFRNSVNTRISNSDSHAPNFIFEIANDTLDREDIANLGLGFMMATGHIKTDAAAPKTNFNRLATLGKLDFLIGRNDGKPNTNTEYYKYQPVKYSANVVPIPAALPLLATAIALFGFGANRRRV